MNEILLEIMFNSISFLIKINLALQLIDATDCLLNMVFGSGVNVQDSYNFDNMFRNHHAN